MHGRWQIEVSASAQAQLGARDLSDPRTFEVAETGHVTVRTDGCIRSSLGNAQSRRYLGRAFPGSRHVRFQCPALPSGNRTVRLLHAHLNFSIVVKQGAASCRTKHVSCSVVGM